MDDLDPCEEEAEVVEIDIPSYDDPHRFYVGDADDHIFFGHALLKDGQVVLVANIQSKSMQIIRDFERFVCPPDEVVRTAQGMVERAIAWCDKQEFIGTITVVSDDECIRVIDDFGGMEWVYALAEEFAKDMDPEDIVWNDTRTVERDAISVGSVQSVSEEYDWVHLNYPGWTIIQQRLTDVGGVPFDILTMRSAEGKEYDIYFNISAFYRK